MKGLSIWYQIGDQMRQSLIRHACDADARTLMPANAKPVLTVAQALEALK